MLLRREWFNSPHSVVSNTVIATSGRLLTTTLGLVAIWLITRSLGLEKFGLYTIILAFGSILSVATDAGLYLTLTQKIATHPTEEQSYLTTAVWLRLLFFVSIFGLGWLLAVFVPALNISPTLFALAAGGFFLQLLSQLLLGFFQKYSMVWRATAGDVVGRVLQIIVLVLLAHRYQLAAVILAFTVGAAATFATHYFLAPVRRLVTGRLHWSVARVMLLATWPLGLMLLTNVIYFRIDTLILSFFHTSEVVGRYGLAYRIIESGLFFPAMFGGLLLPQLAAARQQASQWLAEGIHLLSLVAGLALLLLISFADPLTRLFGTEYTAAAPLLQILSLAFVTMLFGNLFGYTLVAFQQGRALLKLYVGLVVLNGTLNIIFIPHYGATAAAWTTVLTELASMAIAARLIQKHTPLTFPGRLLISIGIITGVAIAFNWWLQNTIPLALRASLTLLLYGLLVHSLGLARPRHFKLLWSARPI